MLWWFKSMEHRTGLIVSESSSAAHCGELTLDNLLISVHLLILYVLNDNNYSTHTSLSCSKVE